jgi:hypothetical protein
VADPRQTGPNPVDTYWSLTRRRRADARRQHFRDRTNRTPKRPMSQSEAIAQAREMPGVTAYVCRYCGSWHVGHGHKGRAGRPEVTG